ncbi:MAG: T9SS type A sorting domain-containing protein [Tunicatimonas sp.]
MRILILLTALQSIWLTASAQEQWFSDADIAGLNPPTAFAARNHAVSFVIGDTAYIGTGDKGSTTTDFWKYVPATKTWTQIADFPGLRRSQAVAFALNGKGYVGTGRGDGAHFDDFYRYDPTTDTWNEVAPFGGGVRRNAVAFVIGDKAYVGTGNTSDDFKDVTDDLWEYNATTDAWIQKSNVTNARSEAVAFSIGGKGYIGCGSSTTGAYVQNMYEYSPDTDSFRKVLSYPSVYARYNGVAFVLEDTAYIGLGLNKKDFVKYHPDNDLIVSPSQNTDEDEDNFGASGETNRWGAIAFTVRGKAFVGLGGVTGVSTKNRDLWSFQSPIPDTPENLTVATATQTSVTLRWTSHANNETGYEIERSENNVNNFGPVIGSPIGIDTTEFQQTTLPVNKEFFYRVRAMGSPDSPYSDTVLINTYNPPSALIATVASATEITLNWQDNSSGEQGFIIQRSTNGTSYVALDTVLADVITFSDQTAQPGFDYTYRVLAQATESTSAASNAVTAGSLTSPTNLTADATGGTLVQLRWSYSGNNAGRFVIERRASGSGEFTLLANVVATASPSYQDKTVEEATSYDYQIKAEDLPRSSTYSLIASATTLLLAPQAVTATVQDSTVAISWTDVSKRENHYLVQRSLADGSGTVTFDTLAADASNFIDIASLSAGDYRYTVQALGTTVNSDSVVSNTITIVEPPKETEVPGEEEPTPEEEEEEVITGTDEVIDVDKVKVYPNPSVGQVDVYVGNERAAYLAVFNSQGRLVKEVQQAEQSSSATVQLDLQFLPVGVYTLRVYTSQGVFVRKIARR